MSCGSRLRGKRKSTLIKTKLHFYNHALLSGQLPMLDRQIAEGRIAWFGILNDFLQVSALELKILQLLRNAETPTCNCRLPCDSFDMTMPVECSVEFRYCIY